MLAVNSLQETANKIGWVWYLLLVLVVLGAIIWWMYSQTKKQQKEQQQKEQPPAEQEKPKKQMASEASEPPDQKQKRGEKDDLTKIEGIGPKVAGVLSDAGITNFAALSRADPAEVKTILNEAGLRMMNPEGWIEQARFAAKQDWEGLQKLQDELVGGRRR